MNLEDSLESVVEYTNMLIEAAIAQNSMESMGDLYMNISRGYRGMGIYDLLINASTDGYYYGLIQSGLTRKHYLTQCGREDLLGEPGRIASFADPFFDALAANQVKLAREIGRLSGAQWMEGFEYEDDFAHARFLYGLVSAESSSEAGLQAVLDQFAEALEGKRSERLELCQALLLRDQVRFDEAFAAFLDVYDSQHEQLARSASSAESREFTFEANRRVSVEGLAMLRIAESLGLTTQEEYLLCPSIVRDVNYQFVSESFPNLPLPD
jgi:hypothetical protein